MIEELSGPALISRRALLAATAALVPAPAGAVSLPRPTRLLVAMEQLADRLLAAGLAADPTGNLLLSPWSLHATLGLLAFGAQGPTASSLSALLGAGDPELLVQSLRSVRGQLTRASGPGAAIQRAEGGWVAMPRAFLPAWQERAGAALGARGRRIDFGAPDAQASVNSWIARATRGAIPALLEEMPRGADFILASAVHFDGRWSTPFDPMETAPEPFLRPDGTAPLVPMMRSERDCLYARAQGGHAVLLPYAGGSMMMLLATAEKPAEAAAFGALLREQGAFRYFRSLSFAPVGGLVLRLPRFGFDSGADLLPMLMQSGLQRVLGVGADFSGVTGRATTIDAILQRARVAVDERGTVAAAATAAIASRSARLDQPEFSADRPFVVAIGTWSELERGAFVPLFLGHVGDAANATLA
jgi:serine protease inhibitor